MLATAESSLWWLTARLLEGSVYGGVVIGLVWLAGRSIKAVPAAARAGLWWLASLRLLVALLPVPSFGVALLPAPVIADLPAETMAATGAPLTPPSAPLASASGTYDAASGTYDAANVATVALPRTEPHWALGAVLASAGVLWLSVVMLQALQLFASYLALRGMVRRSSPVAPGEAAIVEHLSTVVGLRRAPAARVSSEIRTPMVVGIARATVLLPASDSAVLTSDERTMAICHELAHVRRRDLLFGWVPALAERLFFFHPLARMAAREYIAEREAACDALVLHVMDVAPRDYGEMLVRLGVGRFGAVFTATGAASSTSSLKRRLDMLHDSTAARSPRAGMILFAAFALAAVVPFRLTAQAVQDPAAPAQAPRPVTRARPAQTQMPPAAAEKPAPPAAAQKPAPPAAAEKPAPPAAAQKPAPRAVQVAPAQRASAADYAQLQQTFDDQRASMREMERSLMLLRKQFEELLAEANARREAAAQDTAQRSDRLSTSQSLRERLRALEAERDAIGTRLQTVEVEIEAVRRQLEQVR